MAAISKPPTTAQSAQQLCDWIAQAGPCVVAFSGGVDSAVVAAAARRALGDEALAVTAVSPSLSRQQLETARRVAAEIGIRHQEIRTDEIELVEYSRNDQRRCFYCKQTLYRALQTIADQLAGATILSGTNADDLHDYRPGIEAGQQARVQSPLAELKLTKTLVRQLAHHWQLSVWDAPASPCLSSRLAYGVEVTPARLRMVEAAEACLAAHGFSPLRVRLHEGDLARIEVEREAIPQLFEPQRWAAIEIVFKKAGFRFVTVDMEGFRSGNLNTLVSISTTRPGSDP